MPGPTDFIRLKARLTGLFWLATIVTGIVGQILVTSAFARLSVAANLLTNACYAGVTVLLYDVLRPVDRTTARFGLFFGTLGLSAGLVAVMLQLAPIVLLHARWLAPFSAEQIQALAYIPVSMRARIFPVGMTFFGVQMATSGWLITRSTFLPRWIGLLLGTGGALYIVGSLGILLLPQAEQILFRVTMIAALAGEGTFTAWLLVKAVDRDAWHEAAIAS